MHILHLLISSAEKLLLHLVFLHCISIDWRFSTTALIKSVLTPTDPYTPVGQFRAIWNHIWCFIQLLIYTHLDVDY